MTPPGRRFAFLKNRPITPVIRTVPVFVLAAAPFLHAAPEAPAAGALYRKTPGSMGSVAESGGRYFAKPFLKNGVWSAAAGDAWEPVAFADCKFMTDVVSTSEGVFAGVDQKFVGLIDPKTLKPVADAKLELAHQSDIATADDTVFVWGLDNSLWRRDAVVRKWEKSAQVHTRAGAVAKFGADFVFLAPNGDSLRVTRDFETMEFVTPQGMTGITRLFSAGGRLFAVNTSNPIGRKTFDLWTTEDVRSGWRKVSGLPRTDLAGPDATLVRDDGLFILAGSEYAFVSPDGLTWHRARFSDGSGRARRATPGRFTRVDAAGAHFPLAVAAGAIVTMTPPEDVPVEVKDHDVPFSSSPEVRVRNALCRWDVEFAGAGDVAGRLAATKRLETAVTGSGAAAASGPILGAAFGRLLDGGAPLRDFVKACGASGYETLAARFPEKDRGFVKSALLNFSAGENARAAGKAPKAGYDANFLRVEQAWKGAPFVAPEITASSASPDYDVAVIRRRAFAGETGAILDMIGLHHTGTSVPKSPEAVRFWLRRLEAAGHKYPENKDMAEFTDELRRMGSAEAAHRYVRDYLDDGANAMARAIGDTLLESAAKNGATVAAALRAERELLQEEGEPAEARRWYAFASDRGLPLATRRLGFLAASSIGKTDHAEARRLLTKAAALGDTPAMIALADLCRDGLGGPKDETAAADWRRKAGEAGLKDAATRVYFSAEPRRAPLLDFARIVAIAEGKAQDVNDAMMGTVEGRARFMETGGKDAGALFDLFSMYQAGIGVPADRILSERHHRRALALGFQTKVPPGATAEAFYGSQGSRLFRLWDADKRLDGADPAGAEKIYRELAKEGHPGALLRLGYVLKFGVSGLAKNDPVATAMLAEAEKKGAKAEGIPSSILMHTLSPDAAKVAEARNAELRKTTALVDDYRAAVTTVQNAAGDSAPPGMRPLKAFAPTAKLTILPIWYEMNVARLAEGLEAAAETDDPVKREAALRAAFAAKPWAEKSFDGAPLTNEDYRGVIERGAYEGLTEIVASSLAAKPEALQELQVKATRVVAVTAGRPEGWLARARIRFAMGDPDWARRDLRVAQYLAPGWADATAFEKTLPPEGTVTAFSARRRVAERHFKLAKLLDLPNTVVEADKAEVAAECEARLRAAAGYTDIIGKPIPPDLPLLVPPGVYESLKKECPEALRLDIAGAVAALMARDATMPDRTANPYFADLAASLSGAAVEPRLRQAGYARNSVASNPVFLAGSRLPGVLKSLELIAPDRPETKKYAADLVRFERFAAECDRVKRDAPTGLKSVESAKKAGGFNAPSVATDDERAAFRRGLEEAAAHPDTDGRRAAFAKHFAIAFRRDGRSRATGKTNFDLVGDIDAHAVADVAWALAGARLLDDRDLLSAHLLAVNRAIEAAPGRPEAWLARGLVGLKLGDPESAKRDATVAAALAPAWKPAAELFAGAQNASPDTGYMGRLRLAERHAAFARELRSPFSGYTGTSVERRRAVVKEYADLIGGPIPPGLPPVVNNARHVELIVPPERRSDLASLYAAFVAEGRSAKGAAAISRLARAFDISAHDPGVLLELVERRLELSVNANDGQALIASGELERLEALLPGDARVTALRLKLNRLKPGPK